MTDWLEITRRNARSVQTTVGWIFWDPGAVRRYAALGLPEGLAGPLGYMAARCAPLAGAGPDAVIAAFGSISPAAIRGVFGLLDTPDRFRQMWEARDEAVVAGLRDHAPDIIEPLSELGPALWDVVGRLPLVGRTFFGAHLGMPRPSDPLLSGWHAVNCLREWRGDTHWAVVVAAGLTHAEASILHNAWLGYEPDWLPRSRGTSDTDLDDGWERLAGMPQEILQERELAGPRRRPRGHRVGGGAAPAHRGRHRPAHHAAVGAARRGAVAPVRRVVRAAVRAPSAPG